MRAAIYTRFSSDQQRDESLEDQERVCRALAEARGWQVVEVFGDRAMSGSSTFRPSYQRMLQAAQNGEFDVLVAEALDRLSRDQQDVAGLYKTMNFQGIKIVTHAEDEINELHVGLKGTMNAMFVKDLALKTHRGQRGRAEAGKSAGGRRFGYRTVRALGSNGEVVRGDLAVEPAEAAVVVRIFEMFASGSSPIAIAKTLNAEGVPGSGGRAWRDTTIRGHALRRTGILRNEAYVGRLLWNRMKYRKDPSTGKRISRMNPASALVSTDMPELRIVDQALWDRVQARLDGIRTAAGANEADRPRYWEKRRSKHLLTGKLFCGVCGGAFAAIGKDTLACGAARRQGTCTNRASIRRPVLDGLILDAMRARLMQPDDLAAFVADLTVEWNKLQAEASAMVGMRRRELEAVERKLSGLIDAIADGLRGPGMQQKLDDLEDRKRFLMREMTEAPQPKPAMHPNLAEVYRTKVAAVHEALKDTRDGTAALEAARSLIERVAISPGPDGEGVEIELVGEIASMMELALGRADGVRSAPDRDLFRRSVKVVAGMRNHRELTPLRAVC